MKLQKELNLTREQANKLFATYHATAPFVRQLSQDLIQFAEEHKLLFTLEDRFCRFNKWETQNREWDNTINRYEPVPILTKDGAQKEFKSTIVDIYKEGKIPKDYMKNFDKHYKPAFTYKALNRLIQGSAADMTKRAMVNLYEQGILPQIQIHDELCLSIKNDKEAAVVKNVMENAIPLIVNNKVNYKKGKNWGTIKEK
jgi:DNA polymerase I-like protein with 3'-5' exonuclease and polymerase domains